MAPTNKRRVFLLALTIILWIGAIFNTLSVFVISSPSTVLSFPSLLSISINSALLVFAIFFISGNFGKIISGVLFIIYTYFLYQGWQHEFHNILNNITIEFSAFTSTLLLSLIIALSIFFKNKTSAFKTFIIFALLSLSSTVQADPFIGYIITDAITSQSRQERIYLGFQEGLKKTLTKKLPKDFFIREFESSKQPLAALRATKKLQAQGVQVLVGFPTSHEAILVGKLASKEGLMAFSTSAGTDKLTTMGPGIYSLANSATTSIKARLRAIQKKYPKEPGLVIFDTQSAYSAAHKAPYQTLLNQNEFQNLPLKMVQLNSNGLLSQKIIKELISGKYKFISMTSYSHQAAPLFEQWQKSNIDIPVFASSSWDFKHMDTLKRFIMKRKSPIFGFTPFDSNQKYFQNFEKLIQKNLGIAATHGMAYGYDLGIVIASTLNHIKGDVTLKKFNQTFLNNLCFNNTSSGKICFPTHGSHATRPLYLIEL